MVEQRN
jgi:hypothetical protein